MPQGPLLGHVPLLDNVRGTGPVYSFRGWISWHLVNGARDCSMGRRQCITVWDLSDDVARMTGDQPSGFLPSLDRAPPSVYEMEVVTAGFCPCDISAEEGNAMPVP
jgi:hypothetical protein